MWEFLLVMAFSVQKYWSHKTVDQTKTVQQQKFWSGQSRKAVRARWWRGHYFECDALFSKAKIHQKRGWVGVLASHSWFYFYRFLKIQKSAQRWVWIKREILFFKLWTRYGPLGPLDHNLWFIMSVSKNRYFRVGWGLSSLCMRFFNFTGVKLTFMSLAHRAQHSARIYLKSWNHSGFEKIGAAGNGGLTKNFFVEKKTFFRFSGKIDVFRRQFSIPKSNYQGLQQYWVSKKNIFDGSDFNYEQNFN